MLKTRVITALALLALVLPSLFYLPQDLWALLVAAFIGIGGWEWGALLRWPETARRGLGLAVTALCAMLAALDPAALEIHAGFSGMPLWVALLYLLSAAFWLLLIPFWLRSRWQLGGGAAGLIVGLLLLLSTWLALVQLRSLGPGVLLAVFAIVWLADIAAYFTGRAFGRRKLAPNISPGKTVEGAMGAVAGVLVYGLLIRFAGDFTPLALLPWVGLMGALTALSIVGDLYESMLKRQAGIKDSSNVLPGHGGVLDRIDSLTSTLPVVALLWLLLMPGQA